MILGLSLIFAFLSYFIYRHLLPSQASGTRGSGSAGSSRSKNSPRPIPMWPFWSTLLQQSPPQSPPSPQSAPAAIGPSGTAKRLIPQQPENPPAVVVAAPAPAPAPAPATATASPDTTPKATLETPTIHIDAIPQISLSVPSFSISVGDGDDYIPSFPSLNSTQRVSGDTSPSPTPINSNPAPKPPTISMPPPPIPIRGRNPKASVRYAVPASPPSTASVLRQSPNGTARPRLAPMGVGASGVAAGNGLSLPNSRGQTSGPKSRKVILEPGHSPLDWARLQRSGIDLRGIPHSNMIKVPPSLLAKHSKAPEDVWTTLNGRVYNITAYLPFHPGGEKDLLRGAGKDSTKLFNATHPWVNVEGMLAECLVGIAVPEEEAVAGTNGESESTLDTVD